MLLAPSIYCFFFLLKAGVSGYALQPNSIVPLTPLETPAILDGCNAAQSYKHGDLNARSTGTDRSRLLEQAKVF